MVSGEYDFIDEYTSKHIQKKCKTGKVDMFIKTSYQIGSGYINQSTGSTQQLFLEVNLNADFQSCWQTIKNYIH